MRCTLYLSPLIIYASNQNRIVFHLVIHTPFDHFSTRPEYKRAGKGKSVFPSVTSSHTKYFLIAHDLILSPKLVMEPKDKPLTFDVYFIMKVSHKSLYYKKSNKLFLIPQLAGVQKGVNLGVQSFLQEEIKRYCCTHSAICQA